jgi:hypothetical protein
VWLLTACTPTATLLTVHPSPAERAVFEDFARFTDDPGLVVEVGEPSGRGEHVVVETDPSLGRGAYRVRKDGNTTVVTGGDVLGEQFGLADVLESAGFRFVHPQYTAFPVEHTLKEQWSGQVVAPAMDRNGLHLHTLHPIEAHYDLWEPTDDGLARAEQIVDWLVKNRGTHLQWPLLNSILANPTVAEAWRAHTRAIVDYAHARGVTVGLGMELFDSGNLQQAFDLVSGEYDQAEVDARLAVVAGLGVDEIELSFGEFFDEEPDAFVATANQVADRIRAALPGVEIATTIHVGGTQRVTYDGQDQGYYFLAQYIDGTLPRAHTVMYYDLFEDAGGAYDQQDFSEHRDFVLDRLAAGEPVGYHPESAYWVAFDDSVPQTFPLYVRSRFEDLDQIAAAGVPPLKDQVLFSSGWEWGYWLNDAATLRMAHQLGADWGYVVRQIFGGWGPPGRSLAEAVIDLGDLQHDALIDQRLAAYVAGRDAVIDLGDSLGIHSQPDRPQLDEVAGLDPVGRADLHTVVAELDDYATGVEALQARIEDLGVEDPVFDEARDGFAIDALRARFAARVYGSALALAEGGDAESGLVAAEGILEDARDVVANRRAHAWWGGGDRIFRDQDDNDTIYRFGYLGKADTLCYWDRERAELANLVRGTTESIPPCT